MVEFLESTWLLWWFFAVMAVLRWFHVTCVDGEAEADRTDFTRET